MGRPSAGLVALFLVLVLAIQAGLMLGKGVLLIDAHEGDALHLIQIILRMSAGQWPHLDFTTPIGLLAFVPVSWLVSLGLGVGHAIMGGALLVAALMLPAIWWAAWSRMPTLPALLFGAFVVILITALVYGGGTPAASISMYYNRWAWAAAAIIVMLTVLPPERYSQTLDGLFLGLCLSFLALSKITFLVAFLPGVLLALVLRRQWRALAVGLITGAAVAGIVTLAAGPGFWMAYVNDLRLVASSGIRPQPGESLSVLLIGPSFLAANLVLLLAIILLRQAGRMVEGVVLLLYAPAFVYVTWQNWGNDPKWLFLLALLLLVLRPDRHVNNGLGWDVGRSMGVLALVATALIFPTLYNLTFSDLRHARLSSDGFVQVLKGDRNNDLAMKRARMFDPAGRTELTMSDPAILAQVEKTRKRPRDQLFGQPLPRCKLEMGLLAVLQQMARDLDRIPATAGKTVFATDTFSNLWLFGATRPLPGGAPWYYGGDAGMSSADFILVPLCPLTPRARSLALQRISDQADRLNLREVTRNDLFILLRRLPD